LLLLIPLLAVLIVPDWAEVGGARWEK